jgi:hypothetical protein
MHQAQYLSASVWLSSEILAELHKNTAFQYAPLTKVDSEIAQSINLKCFTNRNNELLVILLFPSDHVRHCKPL